MRFLLIAIAVLSSCVNLKPANYGGQLWKQTDTNESFWSGQKINLPFRVYAEPSLAYHTSDAINVWNAWLEYNIFELVGPDDLADVFVLDSRATGSLQYNGVTRMIDVSGSPYFRYKYAPRIMMYTDRSDTLVHELGHALGLDHDPGNRRSIMYPSSSGRVVPYLEPQDKRALRWLFNI